MNRCFIRRTVYHTSIVRLCSCLWNLAMCAGPCTRYLHITGMCMDGPAHIATCPSAVAQPSYSRRLVLRSRIKAVPSCIFVFAKARERSPCCTSPTVLAPSSQYDRQGSLSTRAGAPYATPQHAGPLRFAGPSHGPRPSPTPPGPAPAIPVYLGLAAGHNLRTVFDFHCLPPVLLPSLPRFWVRVSSRTRATCAAPTTAS